MFDRPHARIAANRRRVAGVGLLFALVVVGGLVASGALARPTVVAVDTHVVGVSEESTTLRTRLVVDNPNPLLAASDLTVTYAIVMNGVEMATGRIEDARLPTGRSTLVTTTELDNEAITEWWPRHVRRGERTDLVVRSSIRGPLGVTIRPPPVRRQVRTNVSAAFDTDRTRAVGAGNGTLLSDPAVYVNRTSGDWGTVTSETTTAEMTLAVYNPQPFPIVVQRIRYDVAMNGVAVGEGHSEAWTVIWPGTTTRVELTTEIANEQLDEWWVTHVRRDQRTRMSFDFALVYGRSAGTGSDAVGTIPLGTMNTTFETAVFGRMARNATNRSTSVGRRPTSG